MGLRDILRGGVATAKGVLGGAAGVLDTVQVHPWVGQDGFGKPRYGPPVSYEAFVEYKHELDRIVSGEEIIKRAKVTILEPIAPNGALNREEPVDARDKIVLPDGTTGPILYVGGGASDPAIGRPYMFEITLGESA